MTNIEKEAVRSAWANSAPRFAERIESGLNEAITKKSIETVQKVNWSIEAVNDRRCLESGWGLFFRVEATECAKNTTTPVGGLLETDEIGNRKFRPLNEVEYRGGWLSLLGVELLEGELLLVHSRSSQSVSGALRVPSEGSMIDLKIGHIKHDD